MSSEKIAQALNDLIQINNDRIAGYEWALHNLSEDYLNVAALFKRMIADSNAFKDALSAEIAMLQEPVADGTSGMGKLYRSWMDVKAIITAGNISTILSSCETIENAIQKAYEDALDEEGLTARIHSMITQQKAALLEAHHNIKHLLEIASAE